MASSPTTTHPRPHRHSFSLASFGSVCSVAVLVATLPVACGHDDSGAPVPFTTRVSVATGGTEAVGGPSGVPAASADGRYIAFASDAANLVPADGNGTTDVFVYDSATGQTTRVSVSSAGSEATGGEAAIPP